MNILVLNCGSSSLKYQLINMDDESVIAKGLVERIGIEGSVLTHKPTGKDKSVREQNRRVEVYMYASEQMIKDAQAATH